MSRIKLAIVGVGNCASSLVPFWLAHMLLIRSVKES